MVKNNFKDGPMCAKLRDIKNPPKGKKNERVKTGIPGFDTLLGKGIPKGSSTIVAGGPGCGKTVFCLQTLYNMSRTGAQTVYISLEESPERLQSHMEEFGFDFQVEKCEEDCIVLKTGTGKMAIRRLEPIVMARAVEALLEKSSGTLPKGFEAKFDLIPKGFEPSAIAWDSISAMETAFSGESRQYRIYIEQLFRHFERIDATSFLITETVEAPTRFSKTGVEEFLADGIIALYSFRQGLRKQRAIEIVKMRGVGHSPEIVPMDITANGLTIHSEPRLTVSPLSKIAKREALRVKLSEIKPFQEST